MPDGACHGGSASSARRYAVRVPRHRRGARGARVAFLRPAEPVSVVSPVPLLAFLKSVVVKPRIARPGSLHILLRGTCCRSHIRRRSWPSFCCAGFIIWAELRGLG